MLSSSFAHRASAGSPSCSNSFSRCFKASISSSWVAGSLGRSVGRGGFGCSEKMRCMHKKAGRMEEASWRNFWSISCVVWVKICCAKDLFWSFMNTSLPVFWTPRTNGRCWKVSGGALPVLPDMASWHPRPPPAAQTVPKVPGLLQKSTFQASHFLGRRHVSRLRIDSPPGCLWPRPFFPKGTVCCTHFWGVCCGFNTP